MSGHFTKRLQMTEEMEKNPTEKQIDIVNRLRLASSMLNSIVSKKRKIQEQKVM
jgi:hypothetical protein